MKLVHGYHHNRSRLRHRRGRGPSLGDRAGRRRLGGAVGWLHLENTPLAFLGSPAVPFILTVLMLAELVADKLPRTPSRTKPGPFIGRIVMGGFAGAALAAGLGGSLLTGTVGGGLGAVAGTLGGHRARTGLVRTLKVPDYVIALLEDAVAIGGALFVVSRY